MDFDNEILRIKQLKILPPPPPKFDAPPISAHLPASKNIQKVQDFIEALQYNYTGKQFVKLNKTKGMSHVHAAAEQLINAALPIQCVEAVFLGCHLTCGLRDIDRIPVCFKSVFNGQVGFLHQEGRRQ